MSKSNSSITVFREYLVNRFQACEVQFKDILASVQSDLPDLCDDKVVCMHDESSRPEWQHQVRHALDYMKNKQGILFQETREQYIFP